MTNNLKDLDDSIDDMLGEWGYEKRGEDEAPKGDLAAAVAAMHTEPCKKCNGSGVFRGYTGRSRGNCFTCKGTGTLSFKTAPEARAAARESVQRRKLTKADEWGAQHTSEYAWMKDRAPHFGFAKSMLDAVVKYGFLTEKQLETVQRLIAQDAERKSAAAALVLVVPPTISVARIEEAFQTAMDKGVKRPSLRLDTFKFKPAPATSKNAGSIYVTEDETYLGRVTGGKFIRMSCCDAATEKRIIVAASDPKAAAIAYGRRTGTCSTCGRPLTNHGSIDAGIGPICAGKYGF